MAMTVKKSADTLSTTVFVSNKGKVADSPMGMSVSAAELVNGSVLLDGSVLAEPVDGIAKVQKAVKCLTGTTTTSIVCLTAGNQFKVGDIVGSKVGGKAYAITEIVSDAATKKDTMTIGTAIDAPLSNGNFIFQMAAESTGVDASLNIAYANDTCTGLTDDATSEAETIGTAQATKATVVGTIGAAGAGNAALTVSSDLFDDVVLSVAVANDDTNLIVAEKFKQALLANETITTYFDVVGYQDEVILVLKSVVNGAALKYTPYGITGTNVYVDTTTNLNVDVLVIAAVKAGTIGQELLDALLSNNKYISEV
jgi:hypothetical protein